jgi:hypothetical protein
MAAMDGRVKPGHDDLWWFFAFRKRFAIASAP